MIWWTDIMIHVHKCGCIHIRAFEYAIVEDMFFSKSAVWSAIVARWSTVGWEAPLSSPASSILTRCGLIQCNMQLEIQRYILFIHMHMYIFIIYASMFVYWNRSLFIYTHTLIYLYVSLCTCVWFRPRSHSHTHVNFICTYIYRHERWILLVVGWLCAKFRRFRLRVLLKSVVWLHMKYAGNKRILVGTCRNQKLACYQSS